MGTGQARARLTRISGRGETRQQGASAVEMAMLAPFLIVLLFGVIESSWFLARSLDVAQAAREAGRMAGVNDGDGGPHSHRRLQRDGLLPPAPKSL